MNDKFQNVLKNSNSGVPPIWMMRQAGRYHSHYQNLRKSHSFMALCKEPSLAAEVALGPVRDFDFDVAILFSDLLFPLEAMGMGLEYTESGPRLGWHLTTDSLPQLKKGADVVRQLEFQKQAMIETRKLLPTDKSLIGFVGSPWTLFVYAVCGSHAGALVGAKSEPALFKAFADILTPLLIQNIALQIEGGAEVVMLFDTAAGELPPDAYTRQVVPELEKIAREFPGKIGYYSKGTNIHHFKHPFFQSGVLSGVGVDYRFDMPECFDKFKVGFIQGNFDPSDLFLSPEAFENSLTRFVEHMKRVPQQQRNRWVCGLGHGILPKTPEAHVRRFIEVIRREFK